MMDDTIYSIGGADQEGKVLKEIIEIDIYTKEPRQCNVEGDLPATSGAALAPVFYQSKCCPDGSLKLRSIAGEINWGEAHDLIKHEGFYLFGGRNSKKEATNDLYIIGVKIDPMYKIRAIFVVTLADTVGMKPPPRHSHTMNFMPKLGVVVIYGGRNDQMKNTPILGDVWMLKLHNMEYQKL